MIYPAYVTLLLEERLRPFVNPFRSAPDLAAAHLPSVLDVLFAAISEGISTGPVNAPMMFLAELFVGTFFDFTGRDPGRTWDEYRNLETGRGVEVCRLLARELIENLPEAERPAEGFDMAKTYRRAVESRRHEVNKGDQSP